MKSIIGFIVSRVIRVFIAFWVCRGLTHLNKAWGVHFGYKYIGTRRGYYCK